MATSLGHDTQIPSFRVCGMVSPPEVAIHPPSSVPMYFLLPSRCWMNCLLLSTGSSLQYRQLFHLLIQIYHVSTALSVSLLVPCYDSAHFLKKWPDCYPSALLPTEQNYFPPPIHSTPIRPLPPTWPWAAFVLASDSWSLPSQKCVVSRAQHTGFSLLHRELLFSVIICWALQHYISHFLQFSLYT